LLLGIAGTYNRQLEVGQAYEFSQVACYGVGVGSGSDFKPAGALGWPQWQNTADQLQLAAPHATPLRLLLTGCSASAGPQDVAWRTASYPEAVAEDMEGFGVALACHLSGLPLRIVRGISNHAGERRHADWKIAPALEAVIDLALKTIEHRVEQPQ
jgi:futalosine hydrolase